MPHCFELTDKKTGRVTPLIEIDRRLCEGFNITPDPKKWYYNWYNYIGLLLATGQSFDMIRADLATDADLNPDDSWYRQMHSIASWLDRNYTARAWYEFK